MGYRKHKEREKRISIYLKIKTKILIFIFFVSNNKTFILYIYAVGCSFNRAIIPFILYEK
jgi:hypothetical protein